MKKTLIVSDVEYAAHAIVEAKIIVYRYPSYTVEHNCYITCPKCGEQLGYYYFEKRIYGVRCSHCNVTSLVSASCPREALLQIGEDFKELQKIDS